MSGIVGHTAYALLAAKAARSRGLGITSILERHRSAYLAGAYLGCDVQTLPAAVCVDTGRKVGYGSTVPEKSPITGGKVRPWKLRVGDEEFSPEEVHARFYGRSHLILGWKRAEDRDLAIGWADYLDYAADVAGDAIELFGPAERPLAYVFGWMTHVTGDGLIKSVLDGINLHLLDGTYTAKNRPVQDLVTFHEIGRKELGWNWPALLDDLATTRIEPVQAHYMRCGKRQGRLGAHFEEGWDPAAAEILRAVMLENRRYQRIRNRELLARLALREGPDGEPECDEEFTRTTGGLRYQEMVALAEEADFRHALWQMGELIADLFERVVERQERLLEIDSRPDMDWEAITKRWVP